MEEYHVENLSREAVDSSHAIELSRMISGRAVESIDGNGKSVVEKRRTAVCVNYNSEQMDGKPTRLDLLHR